MKTGKLLIMSLLGTTFLGGCTNTEEPVTDGTAQAIEVNAGIAEATRAVISGGYANDLEVSFARLDNPGTTGTAWNTPSIDAVRTGGTGNTVLTFEPEQTYLAEDGESVLIGYYPRKALNSGTTNPVSVTYTITGEEDIMATGVQTGSLVNKFETFTFNHLLTQLQFKCTGSAGAISKWTAITSIKVKNVATGLKLSLDKTKGAQLTATGTADQTLTVKNCPSTVLAPDVEKPSTGYLLLYPTANLGTEDLPVSLEVKGTYDGSPKTLDVTVSNISEGVKAGYSHLITLTFTEDGKIAVETGIAQWQPGNNGSTIITPGK
ncbi:fimbrillin family protein [uncultured Parabacteroides sp.]|uniref:fimbrillin family protein n=1 Tax=uncultured Parabacteroides sp. TaxID=512312 RepID=UPI002806401E|nr:fimbrillin family protein [uncultured Parabacteroides sp.]